MSNLKDMMDEVFGRPKYSKAKWLIDQAGALCMGDQQIAYPKDFCRDDEVDKGAANLQLAAMAPDLLQELVVFVNIAELSFDDKSMEFMAMISYAKHVIRRAQGEK